MRIDIISLFPEAFSGPLEVSLLKRAQEKGILEIHNSDLREEGVGKHQRVDDRPFGGGPGMLLMPSPVKAALEKVRRENTHVVYLSPQGAPLTAKLCQELAQKPHLVLLCGHYEGIDERIVEEVDQEISIGDYVLTNGALPAMVLIDAVARFIPGVIGHEEASSQDSFQKSLFDCPHYTRPEEFEGKKIPEVLLGGDHKKIAEWRFWKGLEKTKRVRPDLYEKYLSDQAEELEEEEDLEQATGESSLILVVEDLKELVDFYRRQLKLKLLAYEENKALFAWGKQTLTIIRGAKEASPAEGVRLKLICADLPQYLGIAKRLKSTDKEILKTGEIAFQDPAGYRWIVTPPKENRTDESKRVD